MTKPTISAAVGASANSVSAPGLAADIQNAMTKAVEDAYAEGVTDDDEVRARMLAAREAVKQEAAENPA